MRQKVFYLSFTSILLVQTLQVGYSSAKPYLKQQYKLETSFLALMDCFIAFSIAFGFFLRFKFIGSGQPIKSLRINGVMMCFFFLCIPVIPLMHKQYNYNVETMLLGSCAAFGFLFSFFWPCLRSEFHNFYSRQSDECVYTCWTSARNLGKVLGFVFMTMTSAWTWQVSLIVLTVLNIIEINILYYYMITKEVQLLREAGIPGAEQHGVIPQERATTLSEFWEFSKDCFLKAEIRYFIIICGLIKAVNDNFISWLPTYLFAHNFKELAGQITLAFVIPIVTGSFVIGKLYEHHADQQQTFFSSIIFLVTTSLISIGGLILLSTMNMNYIQFIMVIFVEGAVVGGFFNIIDQQRKIIAQFSQKQNQMHWTLCRGFNSFMTGVVNWVVCVVMGSRQKSHQSNVQDSVFYVLLAVSIIGLMVLGFWIRSIYQMFERQEEERQFSSIDS